MRPPATLLLALLLAACASAKTNTYTLSAVPPARPPAGLLVRPPLEVGEVSVPATIDRDEIVLTAPGDQLNVANNSVWGAPVDQLIRRALSDNLSERLPPGSVLAPGDPAPPRGLRMVTVSIDQFGGDTSGHVVLRASWITTRPGERPSGAAHRARIEVDASAGTPRAVVPAMSKALAQLADRIAATVS